MPRGSQRILRIATGFMLVLLIFAYWPGLSGPFLFDDFANLNALGAFGPMDDWRSFFYYLTSGKADPTGRPVAMLTFLIDSQSWPASPWPFKLTNLVLHLLNTTLLAWVLARLQVGLQQRKRDWSMSRWTPLLAASLWGAHPFLVSTTLYVVQREAMLPMTFVLLALLAWDRATNRFVNNQQLFGWLWAIFGFGGATLFAGLSKANGFLAPLLVGLAYVYCLRPSESSSRRAIDRAALVCLALPSAVLLAYLVNIGVNLWSVPDLRGRDWTIPERLLSQPRALWDYVWHLVLPRAGGGGLFVEGFAASRGWLQPPTTAAAAVALLASVVAALVWRRRFPLASFAWLFFLAAHLLESTVIALELYFEHRNYLPAMFLGWPIAHFLLRPAPYPRYRQSAAALLLAALLLLTHQRATTWGDPALMTALTAAHQSQSVRAQIGEAKRLRDAGKTAHALASIHKLQIEHPNSVAIAFNAIGMECRSRGKLAADTLARAERAARHTQRWTFEANRWLQEATSTPVALQCNGFGVDGLRTLLDAAEANPVNRGDHHLRNLWHVRGRLALTERRPSEALHWFNANLELEPDPAYALVQAAALGDAREQALGVAHLDYYTRIAQQHPIQVRDMPSLHEWLLRHYGYYQSELENLRRRLQADAIQPRSEDGAPEQSLSAPPDFRTSP